MTQVNPPQVPVDRLSTILERFIDATTARLDQQDSRLDRHDLLISRLADVVLELRETTSELRTASRRQDQMLEELRAANLRQEWINDFLIRRHPQDEDPEGSLSSDPLSTSQCLSGNL